MRGYNNSIKMSMLPKLIPIKIPQWFLIELDKLILELPLKKKSPC